MAQHRSPRYLPHLLASAIGLAITSPASLAGTDQPAAGLALKATRVTAPAADNSDYQVKHATSPKHTAALLDTPRSISVIPRQVLRDTGTHSLQDALRSVPGISFGAGEGGNPQGDRPFIRGFDAQGDTYVDGIRDTGAQTREIFAIERIEVSKGPNSAFGGRGNSGGSLNLVSKAAKHHDFADAGFTYGSDLTRRYQLDLNRQVLDNSAFRLNLMSHEQQVAGRDAIRQERRGVAPALSLGLDGPLRLDLSHYHLRSNDLPDSGIPYAYPSPTATAHRRDKPTDGGDRRNFYGLKGRDFRKTGTDISTLGLEHELNEQMTFRHTLRLGKNDQDYLLTQPDGSKLNVNRHGRVWRRANSRISSTRTRTLQSDVFGEFQALGIRHRYSSGLEWSAEQSRVSRYEVAGYSPYTPQVCNPGPAPRCTSLNAPNPDDSWTGSIARSADGIDTRARSRGAYLFDTLELDPHWRLNLGLRHDRFSTVAQGSFIPAEQSRAQRPIKHDSQFWNWQAGLVWKPRDNASLYLSYATAAAPPGALVGEGSDGNPLLSGKSTSELKPEETVNYELGTRWQVFDQGLSLAAALFRTEKQNTRILVDTQTYRNQGRSRVDGLELSASGRVNPRWQVYAGYSLLHSQLLEAGLNGRRGVVSAGSSQGNAMPNTPRHSLSLWSSYQVLPSLSLGGGAFHVGKVYGNTQNTVYVPSYTRYDAMARYQVSTHLELQLNVQNLTNQVYYDKTLGAHFANQAPGRTLLLASRLYF